MSKSCPDTLLAELIAQISHPLTPSSEGFWARMATLFFSNFDSCMYHIKNALYQKMTNLNHNKTIGFPVSILFCTVIFLISGFDLAGLD